METAPARDTDFHGYGPSIRERLAALVPGDEDMKVLDVGTGMATTSRFLLERLSKKSHVWSLDPSGDVIEQAKATFGSSDRRRITFVRGTASDMKFEDDTFDVVVSVMVMHHMEAVDTPIAEMSRVLKRGGRLVVIDFSPKAHTLDFSSRHAEKDFFAASTVVRAARAAGLTPRVEDHDKWYLVEGRKN